MNELLRWVIPFVLLGCVAVSLARNLCPPKCGPTTTHRGPVVAAHVVIASWFLLGLVYQIQGGAALWGIVDESSFFLRHNPSSVAVEVGPLHWVISLVLESLVIGLGPFALAILIPRLQPAHPRSVLTRTLIVFGVIWSTVIGLKSIHSLVQWAGVVFGSE